MVFFHYFVGVSLILDLAAYRVHLCFRYRAVAIKPPEFSEKIPEVKPVERSKSNGDGVKGDGLLLERHRYSWPRYGHHPRGRYVLCKFVSLASHSGWSNFGTI